MEPEQRDRFIERIEGLPANYLDPARITIPHCFGINPDISSGVCNPLLKLQPDEPCECVLARSCLVARLLKDDPGLDTAALEQKPYTAILTYADGVWAALEAAKQEENNRQRLRTHVASVRLIAPKNPFRPGSLRHFIVDTLAKDWISAGDLLAKIAVAMPQAKNVGLVVDYVTSITSQEAGGYRLVECASLYRCFTR